MGFALVHSEIVQRKIGIYLFDDFNAFFLYCVEPRTRRNDGVHMNSCQAVEFAFKSAFDIVDNVVQNEHIPFGGDFRVQNDYFSARTIIVNHKIVNADYLFFVEIQNVIRNAFDKRGVRSFAEKQVDNAFYRFNARNRNEKRNNCARETVERYVFYKRRKDGRNQNHGRCETVRNAVRSGGEHSDRIELFADRSVHYREISFREYRENENNRGNYERRFGIRRDRFPCREFFNRCNEKFRRHDKYDYRNAEPGAVFHSAVPERVFFVGFLFGKFEAEQGNYRAAGVG